MQLWSSNSPQQHDIPMRWNRDFAEEGLGFKYTIYFWVLYFYFWRIWKSTQPIKSCGTKWFALYIFFTKVRKNWYLFFFIYFFRHKGNCASTYYLLHIGMIINTLIKNIIYTWLTRDIKGSHKCIHIFFLFIYYISESTY